MNSYTTKFTVDQSPAQVYDAVLNVAGWWSVDIEGPTDQAGQEFTFRGQDIHRSQIRVTELVPGKRVVWHVLDTYMNFVDDQNEWPDTDITFEITERDGVTELEFSHIGLNPAFECYDRCSNAWTFFVRDSLYELITTGTGRPMEKLTAQSRS